MEHSILKSELDNLDILFLLETWKSDNTNLDISDSFVEYHVFRDRIKTAKRNSGGISAVVNKKISDKVTLVKTHREGIIWLKFSQTKLAHYEDLYICCVYLSPKGSSRNIINDDELYDLLYNNILLYITV